MIQSTEQLYELYLKCSGVSTDTRKIERNSLFFALKGPNFNANEFATEALNKGAQFALVDEKAYVTSPQIYLVNDGLEALQKLAQFHREKLKIPVIGITGSNGKTTTKELILKVLNCRYRAMATRGNLNNHIGVPLTILSIEPDIEIAIVEMGANHVGEIAGLCKIAQPTHGLITNIGRAHIEGFGGFEGVIRGKSELYQYLIQTEGVAFINSGDKILANMAKRFKHPVFYPSDGDFLQIDFLQSNPYLSFTGEHNRQVKTQLIGEYNFYNVAAALCIGKYFEVPTDLAEQAVADYRPVNNRSQVINKGTNTVILDAYNANPSSMQAALSNLISMKAATKVAILGDMMELGEQSEECHREVVKLSATGVDQVILCGPLTGMAKEANPDATHFENKALLINYLKQQDFKNTTFLIKASRSMGLEDVVEHL
ncbi:MAG: UDP-N-acetylmuramoyl-tripeptide--D-alanyl-D-alanine ligase [Cyclobacteriaceae bacterium]|nr:MAG: UDP-N-acetylmuramoyl-tripeptide--D-alanyl-D-alanine ligase [Cyclobacteriaceae bacterium]